jgi:hypothetical protein
LIFKNFATFAYVALLIMSNRCFAESTIPGSVLDAIPSISIADKVKMPDRIFYNGPEVAIPSVLGGAVGGVVAANVGGIPEQIKAYLEKNNIDVAEIVRSEFYAGLKADPRFSAKLQDKGAVQFVLEVYNFGLSHKLGFSSEYRALIGIKAKFIREDGSVISEGKGYNKDSVAHPFNYYFEDPAGFIDEYRAGAKTITKTILELM